MTGSWKLFVLSLSRLPSMIISLLHLEVVAHPRDNALNPVPARAHVRDGPMRPARKQQQVRRSLMEKQRVGYEQVRSELWDKPPPTIKKSK